MFYLGELTVAAFFAALGVGSVLEDFAGDPIGLSRVATAGALVSVLIALVAVLLTRGFHAACTISLRAELLRLWSDRGHVQSSNGQKLCPPIRRNCRGLYGMAVAIIVAAFMIAVVSWWFTKRLSRFPLPRLG